LATPKAPSAQAAAGRRLTLTAYSLRQRTDQAFYRDAGPDNVDYITWLHGEIFEIDGSSGADLGIVGETRAGVVDFWRAISDRTVLWNLLDDDTEASRYVEAVCSPDNPAERKVSTILRQRRLEFTEVRLLS
jgi:hypothetical protein